MSKEVVLTGLRTNGEYHLGNYIGALKPMVDLINTKADEYQVNLFAPDLHSFTTPIDHSTFFEQTMANIRLFVACGIPLNNPSISIYRQSFVAAHSELTWILSNFTGYGEMSRMVEYKEKAERLGDDRVSVGLFSYPILMAADILLYDARWVPVGDDQRQHLEFTRDVAARMNNKFGDLFVVPETLGKQQEFVGRVDAPRIRSLKHPDKKMSKSIDDPAGTIMLSDDLAIARKKILSAETDSIGRINYDWANQPGITNLLVLLSSLSGQPQTQVNAEWTGNERYGDLKKVVAEHVERTLESIQAGQQAVNLHELHKHLQISEQTMNQIANSKLQAIQTAVGLRPNV